MLGHRLLERLDAALVDVVPSVSIAVHGQWSSRTRRSDRDDVVDHVWDARLTSASAFTGMAFLHASSGLYWAKAARRAPELGVRVSLHASARADAEDEPMTFAVALDDVHPPGVPVVAARNSPSECLVPTTVVPAGRVICLARCGGAAFFVLLFAGDSVQFGRNRLWRVRDSIASRLPPDLGELLTRRRAGVLGPEPTL